MKRLITSCIVLMLVVLVLPAMAQDNNGKDYDLFQVDKSKQEVYVPGQVLVKFKDANPVTIKKANGKFLSASISKVNTVLQKYGVSTMEKLLPTAKPKLSSKLRQIKAYNGAIVKEHNMDKLYQVKLNEQNADSVIQLVDALNALDEVEYAEPNYYVYIDGMPSASSVPAQAKVPETQSADATTAPSEYTTSDVICANPAQNPLYSQQWGIDAIHVDSLWNKPIINKKRPIIAILDTGVDINHPDLKDNIWCNTKELEGATGYDDDNDGFVDDIHGWDFVYNHNEMDDNNSHGTHVAGIAAASDNALGIVGANPQALIMPVKVLDDNGRGNVATLVKGINYAAARGADVINMSLGTNYLSQSMADALQNAYMTSAIVASAGNNSTNIYDVSGGGLQFPGAYYCVIGVEATSNVAGDLAGFSNYDPDGPIFSRSLNGGSMTRVKDPTVVDGINYEVKAPGTSIISTVLNGGYNTMSGTSMSAPLVAGAISALKMVKDSITNDQLMTDMAHLDCDFARVFYSDEARKPDVYLAGITIDDDVEGNKSIDGEVDAGEIVKIYPTLLNGWGNTGNIKLNLTVDKEKAPYIKIDNPDIDFGYSLGAYGRLKSKNPFIIHVSDSVDNGATVKLLLTSTDTYGMQKVNEYYMDIKKFHKIHGIIDQDTIWTADHTWIVTSSIAVPEGITLTIEPGTRVEFARKAGLSVSGILIANGTPEKPIILTGYKGARWNGINYDDSNHPLSYCKISNCNFDAHNGTSYYTNCEFDNIDVTMTYDLYATKSNFTNYNFQHFPFNDQISESNLMYSRGNGEVSRNPTYSTLNRLNYINSGFQDYNAGELFASASIHNYWVGIVSTTPTVDRSTTPSYLGTANLDIIREHTWDINNPKATGTFGSIDYSNLRTEPIHEAHAILWKIVIDGKNAYDDFDKMDPIGVGTHKFELYFSRPMNVAVAPVVTYGVRRPYTQHKLEDGSWSTDSTIYTISANFSGRENTDGLNQIYFQSAQDNEYFDVPYDDKRFKMIVNAAGSLATGFEAQPGLGRVDLKWNNEDNDFTDAMGFNVYRINPVRKNIVYYNKYGKLLSTPDTVLVTDTVRLNKQILDLKTTSYTDYDVVPDSTYQYFYKVLSTDLKEYDVSNVVAATPLTAQLGDANGSNTVDVADVITTVNYAAGQNPKPFIFEAADMNADSLIDILDVVGIIKKIVSPKSEASTAAVDQAVYSIEDSIVYVDCNVPLAGVQVSLATEGKTKITTTKDLAKFETTSAWLSDNDYIFLAYNLNGLTLTPGKHALLKIGNAKISDICLSDKDGHNVEVKPAEVTGIHEVELNSLKGTKGIYDISGRKVASKASALKDLPKGIYIVDGIKVVK